MTPELIAGIEAAVARLGSWEGRLVRVEEVVSRAAGQTWAADRHFSTRSGFALVVDSVGWAMSGSTVMVDGGLGGQPAGYQLTTDRVVSAELPDERTVCFVEQFGSSVERRSVFHLAPE